MLSIYGHLKLSDPSQNFRSGSYRSNLQNNNCAHELFKKIWILTNSSGQIGGNGLEHRNLQKKTLTFYTETLSSTQF
jgi:hypothetical protein